MTALLRDVPRSGGRSRQAGGCDRGLQKQLILPPGDWLAVRGMPLARARVLTCLALSGSGVMVRIVVHLPVAALEARYRAARDVTEARHYQAIWLLAQGRSFLEVGGVMAFAPRWLEERAARYNTHGPAALGDQRRRNGRAASLLTKGGLAALASGLR